MISILESAFNPWQVLEKHQESLLQAGAYGACSSFIGTMRDMNEGDQVNAMLLEHYPGMTEKHLQKIIDSAEQQWNLLDSLIVHRVGKLLPNDPIVLVAVWSAHRKDAFEACRFIMEDLKSKAPFWKKEALLSDNDQPQKNRWVEKNTSGY